MTSFSQDWEQKHTQKSNYQNFRHQISDSALILTAWRTKFVSDTKGILNHWFWFHLKTNTKLLFLNFPNNLIDLWRSGSLLRWYYIGDDFIVPVTSLSSNRIRYIDNFFRVTNKASTKLKIPNYPGFIFSFKLLHVNNTLIPKIRVFHV